MRALSIFVAAAAIAVSVYVGVAANGGHSGFPLDDAWIHQTYARNWAETGQLAYVAGQPSAGSTAPLWTLLISIAYRLKFDPYLWTLILGAISLGLSAWLVYRIADQLMPNHRRSAWAAGLLCVFEWHLIWAAASGMETMLFIVFALIVIHRVLARSSGWAIGFFGGLLILTRPEGLLLIAPAAIVLLTRSGKGGPREIVKLSITLLLTFAPGVWFNLQAGGSFFPNTFYAKQIEYAVLLSGWPIWLQSVIEMIAAPLAGVLIALIPGLAVWILSHFRSLRERDQWAPWLPLIWIALHLSAYALRLPVHYQHGRYLIPIIPVGLLYGVLGTARLVENRPGRGLARVGPTAGRVLSISTLLVLIVFLPLGASAYTTDVAIIDDEMVVVARWLNDHVPSSAIIAAHDIGAIGYFTRRPLLDLAGLISPEVIPFIRDEDRLLPWMQSRRAEYFVTFPGWYPKLSAQPAFAPIFAGNSRFSFEHLTVYKMR